MTTIIPGPARRANAGEGHEDPAPGSDDTKRFQRAYGDRLVCVRYRQNPASGRRLTTVELIAAESGPAFDPSLPSHNAHIPANPFARLRIEYDERNLRMRVQAAGGTWLASARAWELRYGDALDLGLRDRIIDDLDLDI